MAELRRNIETTVSRLCFERGRLLVTRAAPQPDGVTESLRSPQVEPGLDALSGAALAARPSEESMGAR